MKTAGERLVAMSKDRDALGAAVAGELVGISRISAGLFEAMLVERERLFHEKPMLDYEECLVSASRHVPVQCLLVPELIWAEIDDLDHLRRARTTIYPRLAELEACPGA